jgi:hypothetical protein
MLMHSACDNLQPLLLQQAGCHNARCTEPSNGRRSFLCGWQYTCLVLYAAAATFIQSLSCRRLDRSAIQAALSLYWACWLAFDGARIYARAVRCVANLLNPSCHDSVCRG